MSIAEAVLAAAVLLPLLAPSLACMSRCMHVEGAVAGEPCMVLRDTALAFVEDTRESMRLPVHVGCGVRLGDRHGTHLSVSILSYFAQGGDDAPQAVWQPALELPRHAGGSVIANVTLTTSAGPVDSMVVCYTALPSRASVAVSPLRPGAVAASLGEQRGSNNSNARASIYATAAVGGSVAGLHTSAGSSGDDGTDGGTTATATAAPLRRYHVSHKPVRVAFLIAASGMDGVRQTVLSKMRAMRREDVDVAVVDFTCHPPHVVANMFADAHVPVFSHCIMCGGSTCPGTSAELQLVLNSLGPRLDGSVDHVPISLQPVLLRVAEFFANYDAVVVGNREVADYYLLRLARRGNRRIVRVLDMGNTQGRVVTSAEWRRPPVEVLLVPSLHMTTLPMVRRPGLPVAHMSCSVDTADFDPARVQPAAVCAAFAGRDGPGTPQGQFHARASAQAGGGATEARRSPRPLRDGVNGTVVFGFLARLSSEKALPLFLAAAASVARQLPLARFMVVGAAQHAAAERALAYLLTQYGFGDRMLRLPSTPPADVPALYACMDVFVAPYLRDTFAVANIEAMAMEVPFVHFGLGGLQDYAVHMVNSVRVESLGPDGLADAMLMLARDPALRHSLGAAGRRLAQRQYAYPDMEMRAAQTFRRMVAARQLDEHVRTFGQVSLSVMEPGHPARAGDGGSDGVLVFVHPCSETDKSAQGGGPSDAAQWGGTGTRAMCWTAVRAHRDARGAVGVEGEVLPVDVQLRLTARLAAVPSGFPDVFPSTREEPARGIRGRALTVARRLFWKLHSGSSALCMHLRPLPPDVCARGRRAATVASQLRLWHDELTREEEARRVSGADVTASHTIACLSQPLREFDAVSKRATGGGANTAGGSPNDEATHNDPFDATVADGDHNISEEGANAAGDDADGVLWQSDAAHIRGIPVSGGEPWLATRCVELLVALHDHEGNAVGQVVL